MPPSERASSPPPAPDTFTYNHNFSACEFSFGSIFQEYEFAEQYLPLDFSVFPAHEEAELELSADGAPCLATGTAGISWKVVSVSFCLLVINI